MNIGPLERLKTVFDGSETGPSSGTSIPDKPTSLYNCSRCETVYISDEMQSCPECDDNLDEVPSEQELGLGR